MNLRHPHSRRATTLVENAFVITISLMFLFGIFEYCRFIFLLQICENAAREGARYATAHTGDGTTLTDIQAKVKTSMAGRDRDLAGYAVDVQYVNADTGAVISGTTWDNAPFGGGIRVTVRGTYSPMLPTLLRTKTSIQVRASAMMGSEAN